MSEIPQLPIKMIKEIYGQAGNYTRAKAAIYDNRIRNIFPDTPDLDEQKYQKIEWLKSHYHEVIQPREIIESLNNIAPFSEELRDITKIFSMKAASLIRGRQPQEIRDLFNINTL